jgi:hypothetical protein
VVVVKALTAIQPLKLEQLTQVVAAVAMDHQQAQFMLEALGLLF